MAIFSSGDCKQGSEAFSFSMDRLLTPSQVMKHSSLHFENNSQGSCLGPNTASLNPTTHRSDLNTDLRAQKDYNTKEESDVKAENERPIETQNSTKISAHKENDIETKNPKKNQNTKRKKKFVHQSKISERSVKSNETTSKRRDRPKMVGNAPDLYWRAIPMKDLREHPNFEALPPTSEIFYLNNLTEVSQIRQDTWQWQALHMGRCTTSQAAAAMGLLEPHAASSMGVPRTLWKSGSQAFERLKEGEKDGSKRGGSSALVDLEDMNEVLFGIEEKEDENWGMDGVTFDEDGGDVVVLENSTNRNKIWDKKTNSFGKNRLAFAARYIPRYNNTISDDEKEAIKQRFKLASSEVRMYWGSIQESTAILTALNYFYEKDPKIRVREIGLCIGNELLTPQQSQLLKGLQIGASPDGVLVHSDGRLEALEVKNHCPFVENVSWRFRKKKPPKKPPSSKVPKFRLNQYEPASFVPAGYVPQLMMEMLCLGPSCRSAIMVRQTATKGAMILRLERDDEWIGEMLGLLGRFKMEFLDKNVPPPANFFWEDKDRKRRGKYRKFVERTRKLGESAEVVGFVEHGRIQRIMPEKGVNYIPLFLD